MNDSIYRADSLFLLKLEDNIWGYYNLSQWDSILNAGLKGQMICKNLLQYRKDSVILRQHALNTDWVGHGESMLGDYENGIKKQLLATQMLIEHFGSYDWSLVPNYTGIGFIHEEMGDHQLAIHYFEKSLGLMDYHVKNFPYSINRLYANRYVYIGRNYYELNDLKLTEQYYLKAYHTSIADRKFHAPFISLLLADLYLEKGAFEQALSFAKKSKYHNDNGERYYDMVEGRYNSTMGLIYTQLKEYQQAQAYFAAALKIGEKIEKENIQPIVPLAYTSSRQYFEDYYFPYGDYHLQIKDYDKAIKYYNKSLEHAQKQFGENLLNYTNVYRRLTESYLAKEAYEDALSYNQRVMQIFVPNVSVEDVFDNPDQEDLLLSEELLDALFYKTKILQQYYASAPDENKKELLLNTFAIAADLQEKMVLNLRTDVAQLHFQATARDFYEEAIQFAIHLYETEQRQEYLDLAFNYLERSKATILLAGIKQNKAKKFANVPTHLLQEEEELERQIASYNKLIFEENTATDSTRLSTLHSKLTDLHERLANTHATLKRDYPKYHQLANEINITTLSELQQGLDKQTQVIEYFWGDSTLYVFGIHKNAATVIKHPITTELFQQITAFTDFVKRPLSNASVDTFASNGFALYKTLLAPVWNNSSSQLVIIPDGHLGHLPFHILLESLPDNSTDFRSLPYLFLNQTIRMEYSSTLLLEPSPVIAVENAYVGFAPTYNGKELLTNRGSDSTLIRELYPQQSRDGLNELKHNETEITNVSQFIKGILLLGLDATEDQFKHYAENSGILHLAMHALTNDQAPLYSQLIFSESTDTTLEDGKLHAYELYNMRLNAELAVLSACETGTGKQQKGEGIMSLSRAFKYAGCPNVVMSLWKADDLTTKEIISHFFGNLKAGMGKATALQQARRDFLLSTKKENAHPYYWATFVLIGDNDKLDLGNIWSYWWGLLLIFPLIGLAWILKNKQTQRAT